ncbi:hypothetical protein OAF30_02920 [Flavobacteriales bacterium]|nr:hypothetical protein [Flavobacteriales bacterium]
MASWKPNTPIGLDILIQNTDVGAAEDLNIELNLPDAVNCYSKNTSIQVPALAPGETTSITYDMIVPRNYGQATVRANVTVSEKHGDYGSTWTHNFPFEGSEGGGNVIAVEAEANTEVVMTGRASLDKQNTNPAQVTFNQVPKDVVVTTVAVLPIDGKDCNGHVVSGQDIASFTEGALLGLYNVAERRNLERGA